MAAFGVIKHVFLRYNQEIPKVRKIHMKEL